MRALSRGRSALVSRLEHSHLGSYGRDILGCRFLHLLEACRVRALSRIRRTFVRRCERTLEFAHCSIVRLQVGHFSIFQLALVLALESRHRIRVLCLELRLFLLHFRDEPLLRLDHLNTHGVGVIQLTIVIALELCHQVSMLRFERGLLLLPVRGDLRLRLCQRSTQFNLPSFFLLLHEKFDRLSLGKCLSDRALKFALRL